MTAKIPSQFVPLDVNYAHDRAIRSAGPLAELLFIRGMAYSRRTKTDGVIPDYDLDVVGVGIPQVKKHADALVKVHLWVTVPGGWRIRSWDKWNPVSETQRKSAQARGGARGNHNRWHIDGVVSEDCEFCIGEAIAYRSPSDSPSDHPTESLRIAEREREREERESDGETHHSSSLGNVRELGVGR